MNLDLEAVTLTLKSFWIFGAGCFQGLFAMCVTLEGYVYTVMFYDPMIFDLET